MSLSFKALAATNMVSTMADTDNLVLVNLQDTANPKVQRISLAAFKSLVGGGTGGGGGGGPQFIEFDGSASQVTGPFSIVPGVGWPGYNDQPIGGWTNYSGYLPTELGSITSDGTVMSLSSRESAPGAQDEGYKFSVGTSRGQLLGGGKYWMVIDSVVATDPDSPNTTLDWALFQSWGLTLFGFHWDLIGNQLTYTYYAAGGTYKEGPVAVTGGKLLVALDLDGGFMTIYDSTGQIVQVEYPGLTGTYWNTAAMQFLLQVYGATTTITFNTTDATDSPYAVPTGFTPWQFSTAVPPETPSAGDYISSSTDSNLNGFQMTASSLYLVMPDGTLKPVLSPLDVINFLSYTPLVLSAPLQVQGIGITTDYSNFIVGPNSGPLYAWTSNKPSAEVNTPVDNRNQPAPAVPGQCNTAVGPSTLVGLNYGADYNTALGNAAGQQLVTGQSNTLLGAQTGSFLYAAQSHTAVGYNAGSVYGLRLQNTVALGSYSFPLTIPTCPMDSGYPIIPKLATLEGTIAIGYQTMYLNYEASIDEVTGNQIIPATAGYDVAIGFCALGPSTGTPGWMFGGSNVMVGPYAGASSTLGDGNVGIGDHAMSNTGLVDNTATTGSVAIGPQAMANSAVLVDCVAIGHNSMAAQGNTTKSVALGAYSAATGDYQIQLGDTDTTVYASGAVQDRSDIRDKADVTNTALGLDFVLALRPVDFRWDRREDYIDWASKPKPPAALRAEPVQPVDHTNKSTGVDDQTYPTRYAAWVVDHDAWVTEKDIFDAAAAKFQTDLAAWQAKNDINVLVHDGSKKRKRLHHGFIAQEVGALAQSVQKEFGGWQDHSVNGGKQVQSLGYEEFVAPIVRAIQQLNDMMTSDVFIDKIAARVQARIEQGETSTS